MSNTKHAPTPWSATEHSWALTGIYSSSEHIAALDISDDATEDNQAELEARMAANAAFIVRAVNSHDHLLQTLRDGRVAIDVLMARLIEVDPSFLPTQSPAWPALVAIKAALDTAEAV